MRESVFVYIANDLLAPSVTPEVRQLGNQGNGNKNTQMTCILATRKSLFSDTFSTCQLILPVKLCMQKLTRYFVQQVLLLVLLVLLLLLFFLLILTQITLATTNQLCSRVSTRSSCDLNNPKTLKAIEVNVLSSPTLLPSPFIDGTYNTS